MEFDLVTCILLLSLSVLALFILQRRRGFTGKMTGPRGWPLVGNALQMDPKCPHTTLIEWAKQYGDIFAINLFGSPVVVVSGEKEIREVMVQKSRDFAGRPELFRVSLMTKDGMESLSLMDYTSRWNSRKKILSNHLRMYGDGLQHLEEISNDIIGDLIKTWHGKNGTSFDPLHDIQNAILNIIISLVCGKQINADDPLMDELIYYQTVVANEVFGPTNAVELDLMPWLRFFGHKIFKKLKDMIENHINGTLHQLMIDSQETLDSDNPKGILHSLLLELVKIKEATGEEGNDVINPKIIPALVSELFGAGTLTTSSTLLSLIGHCTLHQDFQNRLRQHILDNIGNRQPKLKDRPQLSLVDATVFEVLRLTTVLPTALPHMTTESTSLGDMHLPKGIMVWPNLWSLHHDDRYWENPWQFNPDRFLDDDGQLVPPGHPNRKRLLAFGAGQRVCMGESLAKNRLFLFVTSLIQHFRFLPTDSPPNCNPRDQKLGIVLFPPPYCVRVELA